MILADTSAWIEYIRATESPVHRRLANLIALGDPLTVTEPVVMEVLVGTRTDRQENELRGLLGRFEYLHFDPSVDFDGAVRIYQRSRAAGITPRGMIDCMIAAVALRHSATMLARDADIVRLAKVNGIELDAASIST